mmetsp:Transcript_38395/g.85495  ORF Transcript_38395/g.85495 Transcript_38395/m.85495 type:complete len:91 (+) Transcript_38395:598-870(+)
MCLHMHFSPQWQVVCRLMLMTGLVTLLQQQQQQQQKVGWAHQKQKQQQQVHRSHGSHAAHMQVLLRLMWRLAFHLNQCLCLVYPAAAVKL